MKLTCPDCFTQFSIDDDVIGTHGRTVRCSQCAGTWFVASDPDVIELREQMAQKQAQDTFTQGYMGSKDYREINRDDGHAALESSVIGAAAVAATDLKIKSENRDMAGAEDYLEPPHARMRDRRERKKVRRRLFGVAMIWGVTLTILALAALSAYILRAQITEKFPVTLKVYQAFNIPVPMAGFEIYAVETRYGDDAGVQTLFINGKIKNVDIVARDVPLLRLSLKNTDGDILASWVVEPVQSNLKSDGVLKFSTKYPNPPAGAVHLATNFVDEPVSNTDIPVSVQ
ncbi:MAG: zinc-ribbon domain-containing protein [Robiginitomaculum sp.]|nr:zinc-ribbon domain-containing protein [Robiginitomaculum sp.]